MQTEELRKTAVEYGKDTPMYLFDMDMLKDRAKTVRSMLPTNSEVCYAIKANPFLMTALDEVVQKFEVCSPGELQICKRRGIAGDKIVFSGVNKGAEDIEDAIEYGVHTLTIESEKHLREINRCAEAKGIVARVIIRLTNGSQFGVDEKVLESMIAGRSQYPHLQIAGIHYFSGTQKKSKKIHEELEYLMGFVKGLGEKYDYSPEIMEYGPGLAVGYFEGEDEETELELLGELSAFLEEQKELHGQVRWVIELGRFIAASCGYYITKVADTKENHGKNYCITDGGINHVNYYGQNMAMRIPRIEHISMREVFPDRWEDDFSEKKRSGKGGACETMEAVQDEVKDWTLCGSLCTMADVLVRKVSFKNLQEGDLLIFQKLGAYSVTEGIYLFLSRRMPKIYAYDKVHGMRLLREGIETNIWNG